MAFLDNGTQRKGAWAFLQAWRSVALVCLTSIAACSNYHTSGPEAWYHENVGGAISTQRPPPPGANDPYPNLATVPAKPAAADAGAWNKITAGLMTDRVNARQAAALAPIPTATAAPAPRPRAQGTDSGASAALVGASPPPPAPGKATKPAPTKAVIGNGRPPGPPPPILSSADAGQKVANGQLPALPGQPPPRPGIAPSPPAPLVPVTATPPAAAPPAGGDVIDFASGSATLNDAALAAVKSLAAIRDDRGIAITGYGDAATSDATGQSDALGLGVSRAQALATALVAQGVPYARLRLNAESAGRGASLRLLE